MKDNEVLHKGMTELHREMKILREERMYLIQQIKTLNQTVQKLKDENKKRNRPFLRGETLVESSLASCRDEPLPPAYRPALGGVRKKLRNEPLRATIVDEGGRIVASKLTQSGRPNLGATVHASGRG